MSPELRNFNTEPYRKAPRAAVVLAALSAFAVGCSGGEADPAPSSSAVQPAESHGSSIGDATHTPKHNQSTLPGKDGKPGGATKEIPHKEQPDDPAVEPGKPSNAPASTPSPKTAALIFKVTGSCHMDGELDNWSKNFTPYSSTHNEITQPDGTAYAGSINDGVDGLGHSQWNVVCSDFAQEGDYTGVITDLGPDNTLGTADDRSVNYTFGISNS